MLPTTYLCGRYNNPVLRTSISYAVSLPLPPSFLKVRFLIPPSTALGCVYPVASGRFQKTEFDWPLSGNESEAKTVASRPIPAGRCLGKLTLKNGKPSYIQNNATSSPERNRSKLGERPLTDTYNSSEDSAFTVLRIWLIFFR